MDDPALVGVHGLETHSLSEAHGLCRQLLCKALQGLLALLTVVAAIDDDAHVVLSARVGDGACQNLHGVDDFAPAPDEALRGPVEVDDDLLVLLGEGNDDVLLEALEQPLEEHDGALPVGELLLRREFDFGGNVAEQLLLPGVEDLHFDVLARKAQLFEAGLDGFVRRLPLIDILFLFHFFPLIEIIFSMPYRSCFFFPSPL